MKLELSCIQKHNNGRRGHGEGGRESALTVQHSFHRPRIPFGQILIERRCPLKHCKRGSNKEKERPTHHKQQKRVPFQKNTKTKENKTCEKCDPMKLELSFIQKTQQRKAWPQREGERVHLLEAIYITAPVFHLDTS